MFNHYSNSKRRSRGRNIHIEICIQRSWNDIHFILKLMTRRFIGHRLPLIETGDVQMVHDSIGQHTCPQIYEWDNIAADSYSSKSSVEPKYWYTYVPKHIHSDGHCETYKTMGRAYPWDILMVTKGLKLVLVTLPYRNIMGELSQNYDYWRPLFHACDIIIWSCSMNNCWSSARNKFNCKCILSAAKWCK